MKTNIRTPLSVAVASVLLCALMLCMTSCFETPSVVIDPVDSETTTTTFTTRATVPVAEGTLTILDLMMLHDEEMPWSSLEGFNHEMTSDSTAHFTVSDNYGCECDLNVTIDLETGYLTEAMLSYGDTAESILTYSNTCFYPILYAMEGIETE